MEKVINYEKKTFELICTILIARVYS